MNIEEEELDVLRRLGKWVGVFLAVGVFGAVVYWLVKVAMFLVLVWWLLFRLPTMF